MDKILCKDYICFFIKTFFFYIVDYRENFQMEIQRLINGKDYHPLMLLNLKMITVRHYTIYIYFKQNGVIISAAIYSTTCTNSCIKVDFQGYGVKRHFQQYFSYVVMVSSIGGGNWSTRKKAQTCCKSLTNFII